MRLPLLHRTSAAPSAATARPRSSDTETGPTDGLRRAAMTGYEPFTLTEELQALRDARNAGMITPEEHAAARVALLERRRRKDPYNGPERRKSATG